MNVNAKQINSLDYHSMDITTALGFFGQMKDKLAADTMLTAAMDSVWTGYTAAYTASRLW